MKKIVIIAIFITGTLFSVKSQTIDEALRYSQLFYGGTARFQAMGGAFTALGGDLSVLSQNPAGLGVFRSREFSFSPQMYFNNSTTDFGNISNDNASLMDMNQAGLVFPLIQKNDNSSGLVSFNLGYSFNRTNNYYNNAIIRGTLENSSMADFWASFANGHLPADLRGGEGLAFDVWMIDTITGSGGTQYATVFSQYGDNANSTYGQSVRRIISSEGYAGEHAFSAATNFSDKIYIGFTFAISNIYSKNVYDHLEADNDGSIFDFNYYSYHDEVVTDGRGYSFKLGAIVKPLDFLRIGFAFHSPVILDLKEYYFDYAESGFDDGMTYSSGSERYRFSSKLTTPMRITTGAALQLGKKGVISADYEFIDYTMARFSNASDNYNYYDENQDIKEVFNAAHNIRMGAEYRVTSSFYLRGGYSLYGSGFADGEDNQDNSYSVCSAGLGMRQSNFFFDISYSLRTNTQAYFMYGHSNLDPATITYNRNMITATLGFRF
ncbi:MAG: outer membrane protein transport protein [Bacteroidales bacterium]|nr:outer membrane protein transport protein [Bacteroidales bacterium]